MESVSLRQACSASCCCVAGRSEYWVEPASSPRCRAGDAMIAVRYRGQKPNFWYSPTCLALCANVKQPACFMPHSSRALFIPGYCVGRAFAAFSWYVHEPLVLEGDGTGRMTYARYPP